MEHFESRPSQRSERPSLHQLLRTPDDVLKLREQQEKPYIFMQIRMGDRMASLLGLHHTLDLKKIEEIKRDLEEANPELLLRETETVITETKKDTSAIQDPQEVLRVAGEQGYLAWIGKQSGMEVKTWDLPVAEWFEYALTKHALSDVQVFMVAQVAKIFLSSGEKPTEKLIRSVLEMHLPDHGMSRQRIAELLRAYTGKSLAEITVDDLETVVSPYGTGPTNRLIRDINQMRDRHAIDVIAEEAASHKKLFITGGIDHILTWEPAIREIYRTNTERP